jgi:hypothetical protein
MPAPTNASTPEIIVKPAGSEWGQVNNLQGSVAFDRIIPATGSINN